LKDFSLREDNVVTAEIINFSNYKKPTELKQSKLVENFDNFLTILKNTLSDEDYLDFLEASLDNRCYESVDEDIKDLVDSFYGVEIRA
jgi:hypothetical protein